MNIKLSLRQAERFMRLIEAGSWLINAHRAGNEEIKEYRDLEQVLLKQLFESRAGGNLIEHDPKFGMYFCRLIDDDEEFQGFIDDYDIDNLFESLIYKLARRDLVEKCGEKNVMNMKFDEIIDTEQPFLERYSTEFEENGLDNLIIKGSQSIK